MIILEEGNLPHPQCPRCDMLVLLKDLNGCHFTTAQCTRGEDRKRRRLVTDGMRESMARAFQDYSRYLEMVSNFKYLGRIMTALDDDYP